MSPGILTTWEWARGLTYRSSTDRRAALPHWLDHYNRARRHSALGNRPPLARVREVLGHASRGDTGLVSWSRRAS